MPRGDGTGSSGQGLGTVKGMGSRRGSRVRGGGFGFGPGGSCNRKLIAKAPVYSNPNVRFQVNQIEDFKSFHALAYCNIHGLWTNSLER